MPSHRVHRRRGKYLGLPHGEMRAIDNFLDFPRGLPHKSLHNPSGVVGSAMRFGPRGGMYASQHILDDMREEFIRKMLKEIFGAR